MLYNALLSFAVFMFCLSLFLVHRASIFKNDLSKLQGDIIPQLNQPRSEGVGGKLAKMSKTMEDFKASALQRAQSSLKISSRRVKREQSSCRAPTSFQYLTANINKKPDIRGNKLEIPWTISAQRGNAISRKENRIVVQEDGYYLVFGQVLFTSQSAVMGHFIQSWSSTRTGITSTELLRRLQEMPDHAPANTCHTRDIVRLHQDKEVQLVVPDRPRVLISLDADSTFFGVIQLN